MNIPSIGEDAMKSNAILTVLQQRTPDSQAVSQPQSAQNFQKPSANKEQNLAPSINGRLSGSGSEDRIRRSISSQPSDTGSMAKKSLQTDMVRTNKNNVQFMKRAHPSGVQSDAVGQELQIGMQPTTPQPLKDQMIGNDSLVSDLMNAFINPHCDDDKSVIMMGWVEKSLDKVSPDQLAAIAIGLLKLIKEEELEPSTVRAANSLLNNSIKELSQNTSSKAMEKVLWSAFDAESDDLCPFESDFKILSCLAYAVGLEGVNRDRLGEIASLLAPENADAVATHLASTVDIKDADDAVSGSLNCSHTLELIRALTNQCSADGKGRTLAGLANALDEKAIFIDCHDKTVDLMTLLAESADQQYFDEAKNSLTSAFESKSVGFTEALRTLLDSLKAGHAEYEAVLNASYYVQTLVGEIYNMSEQALGNLEHSLENEIDVIDEKIGREIYKKGFFTAIELLKSRK